MRDCSSYSGSMTHCFTCFTCLHAPSSTDTFTALCAAGLCAVLVGLDVAKPLLSCCVPHTLCMLMSVMSKGLVLLHRQAPAG
jgi:hypothetical protein